MAIMSAIKENCCGSGKNYWKLSVKDLPSPPIKHWIYGTGPLSDWFGETKLFSFFSFRYLDYGRCVFSQAMQQSEKTSEFFLLTTKSFKFLVFCGEILVLWLGIQFSMMVCLFSKRCYNNMLEFSYRKMVFVEILH